MTPFDDPQAELAWMFLQSLCEGGDLDEGFALLSNDFTYWSIVTRTELDKKTFRRAVERRKQVFEVNIELIRCVNEGETVVVEGHCDGVSADRTRYDSPFVCIFETRDGMIISLREYSDTQSLAEVYPVACATPEDADFGFVRIARDMPRDRRYRRIRVFVRPHHVVDDVAGVGSHAVIAGFTLERAIGAGLGADQPILYHVGQRNILHCRVTGFLQAQRRGRVRDHLAIDAYLHPSVGRLDGDRVIGAGF